jgi:hypothetical protein
MRKTTSLTTLVAAAFLPACSSMSAYESTAVELSSPERVASFYGFSKTWKPRGKDADYVLSDDEQVRLEFFLSSCISELTARFSPPPGTLLRAIQILECMNARDWDLVVEELIGTR